MSPIEVEFHYRIIDTPSWQVQSMHGGEWVTMWWCKDEGAAVKRLCENVKRRFQFAQLPPNEKLSMCLRESPEPSRDFGDYGEPWTMTKGHPDAYLVDFIYDRDRNFVAEIYSDDAKPGTGERIVSCVHAFDGVPSNAIPSARKVIEAAMRNKAKAEAAYIEFINFLRLPEEQR